MPEEVPGVQILSIDFSDPRWVSIEYFDPNKATQMAQKFERILINPRAVPALLDDLLGTANEILERGEIEIVNPPETITRRE